uniref:PHP domain-containing protein n=1 Tax=Alistipes sp. TaxID=1872444 RepID=UPI004056EC1A
MKKTILLVLGLFMAVSVFAQDYHTHYQSATEPQTLLPIGTKGANVRKEIILPTVNGYNLYTADLHVHSTYSDGTMKMTARIDEAWRDGFDIMAATDHMRIRVEKDKEGQTTPDSVKAKRGAKTAKSVSDAVKAGENFGMLIIPGVELTGNARTLGHFNALFTTDNKTIYDYDPIQNIRNARAQGALIMHNHPGWRHATLERTKFEEQVYAEKLVDGVEIMNGYCFYPRAIEEAKNRKWFMTATTDVHATTAQIYGANDQLRNMTIVFAKDLTLKDVREALEARRTLAYSFGVLAGEENLLKDFFEASVETKKLSVNKKKKSQRVQLTNKTSIPFVLRVGKGNPVKLPAMSSIIVSTKVGKPVACTVLSMWSGMEQHPSFKLKY